MAEQFIESTLIDGYVGGPHITEVQIGLANQGLYGSDDYVLECGKKAEAQVLTNNSVRIFDAVYMIQGRRDVIPTNDYTDVSIDNGTQGMNRNDIIVRRYSKEEGTEIESTEYAVIKGTPSSGEASDPSVTEGDIRTGATLHEMKLYRVKITGLNITSVEPIFNILYNIEKLTANSIIAIGNGYVKYANGLLMQWGRAASPASGAGGQGYATVNFPQPFIDTSYVVTASGEYNSNYPTFGVSVQKSAADKAYVYTRQIATGGLLFGVNVNWTAIGRWK